MNTTQNLGIAPAPFEPGDVVRRNSEPGIFYRVLGFERDTYMSTNDQMVIIRVDSPSSIPRSETIAIGTPRYRWGYFTAVNVSN